MNARTVYCEHVIKRKCVPTDAMKGSTVVRVKKLVRLTLVVTAVTCVLIVPTPRCVQNASHV